MSRSRRDYRKIIVINLPDNISLEFADKLLSNIHTNDKGCWVRGDDSMRYTTIKWNDKIQQAHRVSYEIFNKKVIPSNLFGCHDCDVKACINPEHIFKGSASLNSHDAIIKGIAFRPNIKRSKWTTYPKIRKLLKGY